MKIRIDLKILFFLALFCLTGQLKLYLLIIGFVFLHELAHLLVGILLGFKPRNLEIMPFGFHINLKPKEEDYNKKILKSNMVSLKYIFVTIAGPLFNLIFVIIFSKFYYISEIMLNKSDSIFTFKQWIIYSNLLLFIFNLIPIYPLDGGRILKSIFTICFGNENANKIIGIVNKATIILLTAICSIAILYLKNIAVLIILCYLWFLVLREKD